MSAATTTEERLEVLEARTAEQAQTKVEASQRFPIRITGMALFNTFLNSSQNGDIEYPGFAQAGPHSAGATFRQTILGLEYRGPQTVWGGKVTGSLYMDFFGGSGRLLDQLVRLRTARIGIDWRSRSIQAGLDKPIFSPRDPDSLAQVGISPLSGAGNLWVWIPQVRFEQDFKLGEETGVRAQIGAVQTREVLADSAPQYGPSGAVNNLDLAPERPGMEGRFEFYTGSERRFEFAPGFHRSVSHVEGSSVPSNVLSLDWLARPIAAVDFTGAFFSGQNVTHFGTGGFRQGFLVLGPGLVRPVHSLGGWGQVTYRATPKLSWHFFSGQQDDRNSDLEPGRIGKNLVFGANFYYRLAPNLLLSMEASQARTNYIGARTLVNNHYDLALAYLF